MIFSDYSDVLSGVVGRKAVTGVAKHNTLFAFGGSTSYNWTTKHERTKS
jgi:hypothetical protein